MRNQALIAMAAGALTACAPATECADIGGVPGVQMTADDYVSDATAGHSVAVCIEAACGTASVQEPFPFVSLEDLRELSEASVVVVVRDRQGETIRRTALTATPSLFKPGGDACEFGVARLRLALNSDGTARIAPDS